MSLSEVPESTRGDRPAFPASYRAVTKVGCSDCVTTTRFVAVGSTHS
jgi:hypothetical protein